MRRIVGAGGALCGLAVASSTAGRRSYLMPDALHGSLWQCPHPIDCHMPLDGLVGGASTATGIFSGFFVPREERHTADLDMDFGRTELEIMSRNLGDVGSDETNRQVQDWATLPTLARAKQAGRWRRSVP